jgi:hypothetical protein
MSIFNNDHIYRFIGTAANAAAATAREVILEAVGKQLSDPVDLVTRTTFNGALQLLSELVQAFDPTFPTIDPINSTYADVSARLPLVDGAAGRLRDIMTDSYLEPLNRIRARLPRKNGESVKAYLGRAANVNDTAIDAEMVQDTITKYQSVCAATSSLDSGADAIQPIPEPNIATLVSGGSNGAFENELNNERADKAIVDAVEAFREALELLHPDSQVGSAAGQVPGQTGGHDIEPIQEYGCTVVPTVPAGTLVGPNNRAVVITPAQVLTGAIGSSSQFNFTIGARADSVISKSNAYKLLLTIVLDIAGTVNPTITVNGGAGPIAVTAATAPGDNEFDIEVPMLPIDGPLGTFLNLDVLVNSNGSGVNRITFSGFLKSYPEENVGMESVSYLDAASVVRSVVAGATWGTYFGRLIPGLDYSPGSLKDVADRLVTDKRGWQLVCDALRRASTAGLDLRIPTIPAFSGANGLIIALDQFEHGPVSLLASDGPLASGGLPLALPLMRDFFDAMSGAAQMLMDGFENHDDTVYEAVHPLVKPRCDC